jgi:hypothetical protein
LRTGRLFHVNRLERDDEKSIGGILSNLREIVQESAPFVQNGYRAFASRATLDETLVGDRATYITSIRLVKKSI